MFLFQIKCRNLSFDIEVNRITGFEKFYRFYYNAIRNRTEERVTV